MAKGYQLIQTQTLASATSSITFSNIPQNYRDLVIKVSARGTYAGTITDFGIAFNGGNRISDTEFSLITLYNNGTSPASYTRVAFGYNHLFYIPASTATANTFSNGDIYIPNYTSSTNKSVSIDGVNENNATANYNALTAGLRSNTAAITSITLSPFENFATNSTFYLYGVDGTRATGGTITADANYTYHTFTSTTQFTALEKINNAEVLLVAGGGGGGAMSSGSGTGAGGGGAGGVLYTSGLRLSAGTSYTALVGSGGAGGTGGTNPGVVGSNSTFISAAAIGGGGGGRGDTPGGAGGSGGGGSDWGSGGSSAGRFGGAGTAGQGNSGGTTNARFAGGGGGGAGGAGFTNSTSWGGAGGVGTSSYVPWLTATGTGVNNLIAGGGGGGNDIYTSAVASPGGGGGGGNGGYYVPNPLAQLSPTAGTANTGGGGGGAGGTAMDGAAGGSGLVIIRYPNT